MTQYYRAAQAFGAVSSTLAQPASTAPIDLRNFHNRCFAAAGGQKGTTQYGGIFSITVGTLTYAIEIPDSVYSALIADGLNVSDALYNSSTPEGAYTAVSITPTQPNPGLHVQACLAIGDSLTDGNTGSTAYPDLAVLTNQLWSFGISPSQSSTVVSVPTALAPKYIYSDVWASPQSRIIYDFGVPAWRCANQAGYTYVLGSPWLDNIQQMADTVVASGQQICAYIFLGTNDFVYADENGNAGLSSVPTGTPGYTYAGSPDYFTNALIPLITALKAIYPTIKIIWQSPICRFTSGTQNPKFVEVASYARANKAAIGIDVGVDSTQLSLFSPAVPSNSANSTYYQNDNTHLTPFGYAQMKVLRNSAYNALLGIAADPSVAAALF